MQQKHTLCKENSRVDAGRTALATCRVATLIQATIAGAPLEEATPPESDSSQPQPQPQEVLQKHAASGQESHDDKPRYQNHEQHLNVQLTAHRAAADQIASAAGLATHEARSMWDSVDKPLLRIGKSGVLPSHIQSLGELLSSHALVKVQLNAVHADVFAVGRQLADGSGGALLVGKGRTLLLGAPNASTKQLLSTAKASRSRATEASDRKAALVEAGPPLLQLKPSAAAKLRSLISGHVVGEGEFDKHSLRCLAALPEHMCLKILSVCTKAKMRTVRNKSAWLTSQCRRLSSKQPNDSAGRP